MLEPTFWLGLSLFLVAISLTAVLVVAIPALYELARAARSAEKLFDTLARELPSTLDAIRLTGLEISELTDDVTEGVKNAGNAARQLEESVTEMRRQARNAQRTTRGVTAGVKAAWKTFTRADPKARNPLPPKNYESLSYPPSPPEPWHSTPPLLPGEGGEGVSRGENPDDRPW